MYIEPFKAYESGHFFYLIMQFFIPQQILWTSPLTLPPRQESYPHNNNLPPKSKFSDPPQYILDGVYFMFSEQKL